MSIIGVYVIVEMLMLQSMIISFVAQYLISIFENISHVRCILVCVCLEGH